MSQAPRQMVMNTLQFAYGPHTPPETNGKGRLPIDPCEVYGPDDPMCNAQARAGERLNPVLRSSVAYVDISLRRGQVSRPTKSGRSLYITVKSSRQVSGILDLAVPGFEIPHLAGKNKHNLCLSKHNGLA